MQSILELLVERHFPVIIVSIMWGIHGKQRHVTLLFSPWLFSPFFVRSPRLSNVGTDS
jgi:hypothetical protein